MNPYTASLFPIHIRGLPSIVVEKQDTFLNSAVDLALAGTDRAMRRTLTRRRAAPLRRTVEMSGH
jgi:hypothetical protein